MTRSIILLPLLLALTACSRDVREFEYKLLESPAVRDKVNGTLTLEEVKWISAAAARHRDDRSKLEKRTLGELMAEGKSIEPRTSTHTLEQLRAMSYTDIPTEKLEGELAPWITPNDYFSLLAAQQFHLSGPDSMMIYDMTIGDLLDDARENGRAYREAAMGRKK